jgi:formate hydrogenlyase transcriptional activator
MTMMRDTSAIAEPTVWIDDPRTTPSRWADVRRTVEPGDDPSNPAAVHGIIGGSLRLRRVVRLVESVAPTDAAVLIRGETGTGKELIASLIHTLSARRNGPFLKFNCTAIPAGLLESELFGHERGAFTGAIARRIGRFELADGGTLLLDEVGDLPLDLQPKLLRVLEEQEFERVGSAHTIRSDVRVIAATNRSLEELVEAGEFRADLYYRLNVFPIDLPALRERPEDIPPLARHFVAQHARSLGRRIESIPPDVMERLVHHPWPGNVRELQHAIQRAVILSRGPSLQLPPLDAGVRMARTPAPQAETFDDAVREHILDVLRETNGVVSGPRGAAARLGLKRTTLLSKMERLGIGPGDVTTAHAQRPVSQSAPSMAL